MDKSSGSPVRRSAGSPVRRFTDRVWVRGKLTAGVTLQPKYQTTNWKECNTEVKARGSRAYLVGRERALSLQFNRQAGLPPEVHRVGDPVLFDDQGPVQLGSAPCGRQRAGPDIACWPGLAGPRLQYCQPAPEASSMAIGAQSKTTGLHVLVDSTGIKMLGEGEWKTKKHEANYRGLWRKGYLGVDAATLELRAIEIADNATSNAPMLPCLLDQIPIAEIVASVSGDGAYDIKGSYEAIAKRGAQAIIPN